MDVEGRELVRLPFESAFFAQIRSVLSAALSLAVEDEVIGSNPALGVFRKARTKAAKMRNRARVGETVKAMDLEQRNRFFAIAAEREPDVYPAFVLMGLCGGLRLGEALGLKWASCDFDSRALRVHEQITSASTKSGVERTVEMASPVVDLLRGLLARRREESLATGRGGDVAPWIVFPWLPEKPDSRDEQRAAKIVRRAMARCLRIGKLPLHFTPHSLRHTFCSLLIGSGCSPVYGAAAGRPRLRQDDGRRLRQLVQPDRAGGDGQPGAGGLRTGVGNIRGQSGNIGGRPSGATVCSDRHLRRQDD
jgi:integrase